MTEIISPGFCSVDDWRQIFQNNQGVGPINFLVVSDCENLPNTLVEAGFFPSTSRVKKNLPQFWRKREPLDFVKLSWARIQVVSYHG